LFAVAIGWLDRKGREVFRYVIEENRRQLAGQRLQLRNGVKLPDPVRIARAFAPRIPRGF